MWTHIKDTRPVSSKQHSCYLCGLSIPIKTRYVKRVGTDCGEFITMYMHERCSELTLHWDWEEWESHDECEFRANELRNDNPPTPSGGNRE